MIEAFAADASADRIFEVIEAIEAVLHDPVTPPGYLVILDRHGETSIGHEPAAHWILLLPSATIITFRVVEADGPFDLVRILSIDAPPAA